MPCNSEICQKVLTFLYDTILAISIKNFEIN